MSSLRPTTPRSAMRGLLVRYLLARGGAGALVVDAFAGAGYDSGEGRPLPIEARGAGSGGEPGDGEPFFLLLEEDPAKVEWIRRDLAEAFPGDPPGGRTRVEEGGLPELAGMLSQAGTPEALVLLEPPAARALPLEPLLALAAGGAEELLLGLPVAELRRLERFRDFPLADLPPYARRIVEGWSAMLGERRHEWFLGWHGALQREGPDAAERAVVASYAATLGDRLGGRVVRAREIAWSEEGPPEYLVHVAAGGAEALAMNRALFEARSQGSLPWGGEGDELVRYRDPGVLELFAGPGATSSRWGERVRVVDTAALAHRLAREHRGRTLAFDQLLRSLAGTDLFVDDVRAALRALRREGRARFRALRDPGAEVVFPASPQEARRAGGSGARRRRGGGEQGSLLEPASE